MNDADRTIYKFKKNSSQEVRASFTNYHGQEVADLRVYWRDDKGKFHPTKKGLTIGIAHLEELGTAVQQLMKHMRLPSEQKTNEPSDSDDE